jgi:membrane protease YdiL (CAAX protease family)
MAARGLAYRHDDDASPASSHANDEARTPLRKAIMAEKQPSFFRLRAPYHAVMPRLRLGLLLWCAGMLGVVGLTFLVLPNLLQRLPELLGPEHTPPDVPTSILLAASLLQSGTLLALTVWAGTALAPAVGLRAPTFEAMAARASLRNAIRPQLLPGLIGGGAGALVLTLFPLLAPPALANAQEQFAVPLLVRVLYGGVTEEILLRWGVMTIFVWLAWRFVQRRVGSPQPRFVWTAIIFSALLFGAGHLPAAGLLIGTLTAPVIAYVVLANALFGIVAGALFWRYGLEAAIVAHALAHAFHACIKAA